MRWLIVAIVGIASAGMMAVSVAMNFAFGSSFGRTTLESYAYGAAFGFGDILKVAAPSWSPTASATHVRFRRHRLARVGNLHPLLGRFCRWLCLRQPNLRGGRSNRSGSLESKPAKEPGG